ncbi:MAG: hypothetical protein ACRC0S_06300 [Fusobacteriaceae bacterium]
MYKKIKLLFIFILLQLNLFGIEKNISNIQSLKFYVEENTRISNRDVVTGYNILIKFPNTIKKEMVFPELNKGEVYIYKNKKKITYIPLFNEIFEENINNEENKILEFLNLIIDKDKSDNKFKENYYKNKKIEVLLKTGEKIIIKKMIEISGYLLPEKLEIWSGESKISTLKMKNIEVNINILEGEFEIENENNNL